MTARAPVALDLLKVPLASINLIEASAGTGKTHTITDLYLRLLLESELSVGQILVVTYTNAATAELRTRIRTRLREALAAFRSPPREEGFLLHFVERRRAQGTAEQDQARLLLALHSFDEAAIFTIHAFCQRVLRENAFESGVPFGVELLADETVLLTEVVQDFWVRALHDAPEPFVHSLPHQNQKITLRTLEELASRAVTHPDMPILPSRADATVGRMGTANGGQEDAEWQLRALQLKLDLIDYARREMRLRKERARLESYDDLLYRLAEALRAPSGSLLARMVRDRFRAALIDEFQDTDPVQYEIFRRLYFENEAILFLIGDPKQSIYAFRGADVFAYLQAKRDAGGDPHTLLVNHRSDPTLVHAINALFGRLSSPFPFLSDEIPFLAVEPWAQARDHLGGTAAGQPAFQILFVPRNESVQVAKRGGGITKGWADEHLADLVAAEIMRFLGSGATIDEDAVKPGHIAVLCRKNSQASHMQEALRRLGVPSVLQSEATVFETPEADEMERILRATADPGDAAAVRAALATALLGQDAGALAALEQDELGWDEWLRHFQRWNDLWTRRGFITAFRTLLDSQSVHARLLRLLDGERRLTNVLHLMELLHTASTEERRGPHALVHWLSQMRTDDATRAALGSEAAQIRLESDAAAVMLTTIHKSKGLQYPIVYCPYLWDGKLLGATDECWVRFHDSGDAERLKLDIGSPDHEVHVQAAARETFAENLRLLYVALTRARHRCTVVWGAFNDAKTSALGYVFHAQAEQPSTAEARIAACVRARDDGQLRDDLQRAAAAAPDCIAVSDLRFDRVERYTPPCTDPSPLQCRSVTRRLDRSWRMSSFSGLTAGEAISRPAEEGVDHDAIVEVPTEPVGGGAPALITLHDFPAGAQAGDCIHHILEKLDFQADSAGVREHVAAGLSGFGFEDKWTDTLCHALAGVLATPLGSGAEEFCLKDISLLRRLSELEFMLAVESRESTVDRRVVTQHGAPGLLTSARLAEVFARDATRAVPGEYAARVRSLGFAPLTGFLKGFIDLVFEHRGRWYVVDYKSNFLGPGADDYRPSKLLQPMADHHYFLQYHLYLVALHRHLRARLPGYCYEEHIGGVYYLFLRGMSPEHGRSGIFCDRPSLAMVQSLSAILGGQPEPR